MNRRPHTLTALFATLALALAGGCGDRASAPAEEGDDPHGHDDHGADGGVAFVSGTGLLLPEETRQAIGLRLAPVEMRRVDFSREFPALVFRSAAEAPAGGYTSGVAYATSLLPAAAAAGLAPPADFTVAAEPSAAAQLVRVDRQAEQPLGLVELVFALPDPGARWRIGDRVTLRATSQAGAAPVLVVPKTSVLHTATGDFVFAVNGPHLLRTPVKLGQRARDWVEVLDGLFEGDEVATSAVDLLYLTELRAVKGGGHSH